MRNMQEPNSPKEIQGKIYELTLALYRVTDFFPAEETLRKHLREKANELFGHVIENGYEKSAQKVEAIMAKIDAIKGYLGIARAMKFVHPINISVLEREYSFLGEIFQKGFRSSVQKNNGSHHENNIPAGTSEKIITEVDPLLNEDLKTWEEFSLHIHDSKDGKKEDANLHINENETEQKPEITLGESLKRISFDINERQKVILEYLKKTQQAKISDLFSFFNDISSKTIQRDLQDLVGRQLLKKEGEKRWTVYSFVNVQ